MSRRYVWMLLRTLQASGAWGGQLEGTPQPSCEQGASQGASCSAKIWQTAAGSHGLPRPAAGLQRANTKVGLRDRAAVRSPVGVIGSLVVRRDYTAGVKASRWLVGGDRRRPASAGDRQPPLATHLWALFQPPRISKTCQHWLFPAPCRAVPWPSSYLDRTKHRQPTPVHPTDVCVAARACLHCGASAINREGCQCAWKKAIACAGSRAAMAARCRPRTRRQRRERVPAGASESDGLQGWTNCGTLSFISRFF